LRQKLHAAALLWYKMNLVGERRDVSPGQKGEVAMREKVEAVLVRIGRALQADGGAVELMDVKEGVVTVKLIIDCGSRPMPRMTLRNGVERLIMKEVPEVKEVVTVCEEKSGDDFSCSGCDECGDPPHSSG